MESRNGNEKLGELAKATRKGTRDELIRSCHQLWLGILVETASRLVVPSLAVGLVPRGTELLVQLLLQLLAQGRLDVGAQRLERLELGHRARDVVVERRQHLLLDLLHRDGDPPLAPLAALVPKFPRLPRAHADDALLELLEQPARAELDDVVALRLAAAVVDEIDDDDVARLRRAPVDRNELGGHSLQRLELGVDQLARDLRLGRADL